MLELDVRSESTNLGKKRFAKGFRRGVEGIEGDPRTKRTDYTRNPVIGEKSERESEGGRWVVEQNSHRMYLVVKETQKGLIRGNCMKGAHSLLKEG